MSGAARIAVVAAIIAASGCAAHGRQFASRFVKPGEPSATYDDDRTPPPASGLRDYMRKSRALQAHAAPKNSLLPTIESTNPELAKALLLLAMHESAQAHRLAAAAYRRAGIQDYAYRHYRRAVAMEPCDAESYDAIARLWRDWGMPDIALSEVYRALHCNASSAEIHNTLGTILEALDQPVGARRAYQRAADLDPQASWALNNLCYLQLSAGNGAAAATLCERALAISPDLTAARNNLALVQARRGDLFASEQRLRTDPTSGTSIYNVGIIRLSEGRFAEAAQLFVRASAAQPSLTIAWQRSVQARKAARAAEQAR